MTLKEVIVYACVYLSMNMCVCVCVYLLKDGKRLAAKRRCKFLEVSALLDHKVDEVLVTIIRETRARARRRCLLGLTSLGKGGSCGNIDDMTSNELTGKGCLHRAAFAIFRKLFK